MTFAAALAFRDVIQQMDCLKSTASNWRGRSAPKVRSRAPGAMTGYGQESDRVRGRNAGFDTHLVNPAPICSRRRRAKLSRLRLPRRAAGAAWRACRAQVFIDRQTAAVSAGFRRRASDPDRCGPVAAGREKWLGDASTDVDRHRAIVGDDDRQDIASRRT
jgi:hypothetical protein